jgi:hypothetical protein
MKTMWLLPAVAFLAFGQTSSRIEREGAYWVQTTRGEVAVPSGRLHVSSRGTIRVQGTRQDGITYELTKRMKARSEQDAARLLSQFAVLAEKRAEEAWVVVIYPRNASASGDLLLQAPRSLLKTSIETRGGTVEAQRLDGSVDVETAGGRIRLDDIGGDASIRTGGGEIHLGKIGGSLQCLSGGGSIHANFIGRESVFETAGGDIFVDESRGPVRASTVGGNIRVQKAASSVTANTAGGLIDVIEARGQVRARSAAGGIRVTSAKGARCESARGTIQLRGVSGALRASTASGNILAELLSGARLEDSFLNTGGGDVTVFIPSKLSLTVRAENAPFGPGKIVSEFPEVQMKLEQMRRTMQAIAEGALNGGGPVLRISATGGTIYLRREK